MRGKKTSWIAGVLAILGFGSMVHANETDLPQSVSEPVLVRFDEGSVDWDSVDVAAVMQVFVGSGDGCCEGRQAVAGRYLREGDQLAFTPAFGFVTAQTYVLRTAAGEVVEFEIPSDAPPVAAIVTETFPSGEALPENTLRFYIHFSVPMAPHVALDHIRLLDADGAIDDAAFMRFGQELWNEDRTRLTVLIDPGRIKRDVATNLDLGPALLEGQTYTLAVAGGWPSADGHSVLPPFFREFTVSAALRERPDVRLWEATPACTGTREPLTLSFDRPFDRHLLGTSIHVVTSDGQPVAGTIEVGASEHSWHFTPTEPWPDTAVQVVADTALEDVAGNNFRDLLDQPLTGAAQSISPNQLPVAAVGCELE